MIYLLTQMILCLVLAGVTGGAAGWLLHRARAGREDEALRETIVRQHHQLRHAETDVAMLTDDFDDLKQRSQAEIETLRRDNRRLPTLLQNLDKSQTLVRQLMQKHEGQLREAAQQNESLRARLTGHDEREAAFARARSELESARAELVALRADDPEASPAATPPDVPEATSAAAPSAVPEAISFVASLPPREPEPAAAPEHATTMELAPGSSAASGASEAYPVGAPPNTDGARYPMTPPVSLASIDVTRTGFETDPGETTLDDPATTEADDDDAPFLDDTIVAERPGLPGLDRSPRGAGPYRNDGFEAPDTDPEGEPGAALDDPDDDEEDEDDLLDESVELLFEPVDRHDDLQRIFGIGPVTERALNRLGITSYSQLAELQRHEVEQIADALQIYPGRIERDDWVGNARRQLEDVLEEL